MEPKTYAAFRWASQAPGAELTARNTTLVEFRVEPADDAVRVRVIESGFAALDAPAAVRDQAWHSNTEGWREELAGLAKRAEAA